MEKAHRGSAEDSGPTSRTVEVQEEEQVEAELRAREKSLEEERKKAWELDQLCHTMQFGEIFCSNEM
mgnify:CR=1 FL=1